MDPALAAAALSAIAATTSHADAVYTSWSDYVEYGQVRGPTKQDFLEKITVSDDASVLRHEVAGTVKRSIKRSEFDRLLTENEAKDITDAEREMKALVDEWLRITRCPAPFTSQQRQRLDQIAAGLTAHICKITARLAELGFELDDHYEGMRRIAESMGQT